MLYMIHIAYFQVSWDIWSECRWSW